MTSGITRRSTAVTRTTPAAPVTRRALREAELAAAKVTTKAKRPSAKKSVISITVMTLTAGLIGTMALPAFALGATNASGSSSATAALNAERAAGSQSVAVSSTVADTSLARDNYTSAAAVVAAAPVVSTASTAAATAAAEAKRAALASTYSSYTGPTASDYLADPAHPAFDLASVYATALKYVGTPYVFGGATPAGFDCSGFVMFVYAQYGISLVHSVPAESAAGTTISEADAQPGDIVVLNDGSHDGFYAGNGMILDAPKPGGFVSVRPLWTTDVHFVRFGIK